MNVEKILEQASKLRIAVVGDLILDRYIDGVVERISPEAPVQILRITGTRENPGGAGNVVENLKGLGCQVSFFHQPDTPIKTRVMSGNHHLLRMDDEDEPRWMQWDEFDIGLIYGIEKKKFDCVVISDYGKGCISKEVARDLIESCVQVGIPVVVDAKRDFDKFENATILKCNMHEWAQEKKLLLINDTEEIITVLSLDHFVVTNGQHGLSLYYDGGGEGIGGYPVDVCDPCGAGDTITAILAIGKSLGSSMLETCEMANIAASEVCKHPGVFAITKEHLIRRFNEVNNKTY